MMRSTWRAGALLLAALVVGGIAGAAISSAVQRGEAPGARKERHEHRERGGHLEMLARKLDLSDTQRDSVRVILDRYRPPMDSIWADVAPRFETLQDRIRSDIRSQLTPDQLTRYDDMVRRMDKKQDNRKQSE